jgi:hypothetical protein
MEQTPKFFVPNLPPSEHEANYIQNAAAVGCPAAPRSERYYSIVWKHNGEEWTATVGECLKGIRHKKAGRGKPPRVEHLGDAAEVQAIFPGPSCFRVVTNSASGSAWSNPILAGVPTSVTRFADDK